MDIMSDDSESNAEDTGNSYVENVSSEPEMMAPYQIFIVKWFYCCLHMLNRCISSKETLELLDPAIDKLLAWLKQVKKSGLHQVVVERTGKTILLPPKTRWAYLALALERALELKKTLHEVGAFDSRIYLNI